MALPTYQFEITIVIISFNTCDITRKCLESVYANSTAINTQVIVIDNDSKDNSLEMLASEFPNVELISNSKNVGFAAANNQGFERCRGEFVLLLNSDTVILGDVLRNSINFMRDRSDVGIIGCRVLNPDYTMQPTCFMLPSLLNLLLMTLGLSRLRWPQFFGRMQMRHWQRDSEREVPVVTGCYMLVRKTAMDTVGWLDESFFFCGEETDWCVRFRQAGWKVIFSPVGEIIHIGNASGRGLEARRDLLLTEGLIRFHRKHYGLASAFLAYLILWVFNCTHMLFWAVRSLLHHDKLSNRRYRHFLTVTKEFRSAWPRKFNHIVAK